MVEKEANGSSIPEGRRADMGVEGWVGLKSQDAIVSAREFECFRPVS